MGIDFELVHNPISEDVKAGENPLDYVIRMSKEKAKAGFGEKGLTIGADTIVSMGNRIFGKPKSVGDAKETLEILKETSRNNDLKILIHCFTGTKEFAFKLLDLGAYISASGVITFKKSKDLADTFKEIPMNRILVETDSPYLAPVPLRGKPNEPSFIIHTVKFLSKLKNLSFDDFSNITTKNFLNLFGELN